MPVRLVVADTGPLNYLVLIEAIDVLPRLFEQILVPAAVYDELAYADAPAPVRAFIAHKPAWLEVRPNPDRNDEDVSDQILDEGERAAIALATAIGADLILMDDRAGAAVAYRHGLTVTGTLGVLDLAIGSPTCLTFWLASTGQSEALNPGSVAVDRMRPTP